MKHSGRYSFTILLLALTLFTAACALIAGPPLGHNSQFQGKATLICSKECARRGQCGNTESGKVVLLSSAGPATSGHDHLSPENTQVEILSARQETLTQVADGQQLQIFYYLVMSPDQRGGWAAGWCVTQEE